MVVAQRLKEEIILVNDVYESANGSVDLNSYLDTLVSVGAIPMLVACLRDCVISTCLKVMSLDERVALLTKIYEGLALDIKEKLINYQDLLDDIILRSSWGSTVTRLARYKKEENYNDALCKVLNTIKYNLYEADVQELSKIFRFTSSVKVGEIVKTLLLVCNREQEARDLIFGVVGVN
jgi:hypothetical protein